MVRQAAALLALVWAGASAAADLTEKDYFTELPVVLTASRLAQPLDETPGAVTVIDRDTIRRSGARELADVLRLVPGYLTGGWNGANPTAAYHAPIDTTGSRNLVLIDGRPVYSAYYLGDTHHGLMGVLLEDVERIEVLRGANSAAYGANAMFGVINIITRHSADTHGGEVLWRAGEGGIFDNAARIGWGDAAASFRLSAGRRADSGYPNAYDDKIVSQLHLRADGHPAGDTEWLFAFGGAQLSAGEGIPGENGNPPRTTGWRDLYLHGVFQRQLSPTDQLKFSVNVDTEAFQNAFYDPAWQVTVSTNGRGRRSNLELQHQIGLAPTLRAVWGAGYKHDEALSDALYVTEHTVAVHESRLFGNLEWRPQSQWLVNLGGFWGDHSRMGSYFAPRLMVNFHFLPGHTLRAGVTDSLRLPTLFELAGDVRYYPPAFAGRAYRLYGSDGSVAKEKLHAREIGYFGNFRSWRLTLDVRGFDERMSGMIIRHENTASVPAIYAGAVQYGFSNDPEGFRVRGLEYQLRWQPWTGTDMMLGQTFERLLWERGRVDNQPPTHATTLALFQKLPREAEVGLIYTTTGAMSWGNPNDALPARERLDSRLALPLRIGTTRVELAVGVQAATGVYPDNLNGSRYFVPRRAYGALRLEF